MLKKALLLLATVIVLSAGWAALTLKGYFGERQDAGEIAGAARDSGVIASRLGRERLARSRLSLDERGTCLLIARRARRCLPNCSVAWMTGATRT